MSDLNSKMKLAFYRDLLRVRQVEETIAEKYSDQEMRCPVHLSVGQEAVAVGVSQALRSSDYVTSTHRSHAHYLAKGGDLKRMLAEIYGKAAGCCGGRGGSMHLFDGDVGMLASVPIVASSIPLGVGAALAAQQQGTDAVSVIFIGDASLEEGAFHESANFAALKKLPVIFVCENNRYSVYTDLQSRQPDRPFSKLAHAHNLAFASADGNDVEAVFDVTSKAAEVARTGGGPQFLLFDTHRWREHCGPEFDDHLGYRPPDEVEAWRARCPVEGYRRKLADAGLLDDAAAQQILEQTMVEIDEAFAFAEAAPLPDPATASEHVHA